jgi:DNA-directed RNA polymerase subunit M/transcription elongation factor TFIIS
MSQQAAAETCPSCGSEKLVLRGRITDGKRVRELVCTECKHAWLLDPAPFLRRLRP